MNGVIVDRKSLSVVTLEIMPLCFSVSSTAYADVDIYDGNSGLWTTSALSVPRHSLSATSLVNQCLMLFAGGRGEDVGFLVLWPSQAILELLHFAFKMQSPQTILSNKILKQYSQKIFLFCLQLVQAIIMILLMSSNMHAQQVLQLPSQQKFQPQLPSQQLLPRHLRLLRQHLFPLATLRFPLLLRFSRVLSRTPRPPRFHQLLCRLIPPPPRLHRRFQL